MPWKENTTMSLRSEFVAFARAPGAIEYDPEFEVRRVKENGSIKLKSRYFFVGKAFAGDPVGLCQTGEAQWERYYCHQRIRLIDLTLRSEGEEL
jgi:hypothetical protein